MLTTKSFFDMLYDVNNKDILSVDVDVDSAATKRPYRKPEFTAHGSIEEVTLGAGTGAVPEALTYVSRPL